ncbi:Protein MAIN-LIKE 1 [Glycine max]|nr:Protein MAIN-LIKE 1 [Glycine max]
MSLIVNHAFNVQIIVKTKGLGWALGRVIRRALVAPVAEDVEHVDHVAEEVHEQPQEAPADDVVSDTEGFPCEPHDTSVLMDYAHHVVVAVWNGEERPKLKLSFHGRKVEKFGRPAPEIEGLETSSFHLPVGKVTITLDDVSSLLHLPITRAFHSFETLHVDDVVFLLVELLEVSYEETRVETVQCHEAYVRYPGCETYIGANVTPHSCTLFANKSTTHVHVVFLDAFCDLTQSGRYAWGADALIHMYENLNDASKNNATQLAGYITLLQFILSIVFIVLLFFKYVLCWIYDHFPSVASAITAKDYDERKLCACRWKSRQALPISTNRKHLDRLTSGVVCWISYDDHHALREFELISLFFGHMHWGPSIVIHRPERVVR